MNKKRCAFVAAAVLAVCTVAFLCRNRPAVGTEESASAVRAVAQAKAADPVQPVPAAVAALPMVPSNQTATVRGTKPYVLVSEEPFQKPLRLAAESLGARTRGVLSANELLIEATAETRTRLAADGRFSSVSEFLPSAKIAAPLAAAINAGAKTVEAAVVTLTAEDRLAVKARIESRGGEILKGCLDDDDSFRARMPAELVAELAGYGDVRWMEVFTRPHLMNDVAVEPITMNIRSIWKSGSNPLGLSGEGQSVSTSDSGIDTGDTRTMHADLADRVQDIKVVSGCSATDVNGHGTHTAGSIVGNGAMSDGKIRGTAWGAHLYAWFCGAGGGSISIPSSLAELFRGVKEGEANAWPAYIHSASWGSSTAGEYSSRCVQMDKYVWDHSDFLPVYSAGNDGEDGPGTIGDPAVAKNVLAVGATQNWRTEPQQAYLENGYPEKIAEYSSRGPCQDGRIKPDISSPGTGVLSTRSHGVNYSFGIYNDYYAYDTGTSMACPLTAGSVALIREWLMKSGKYEDVDGGRPTAALMKAIIMGGAKEHLVPNNNFGAGRTDIAETLFPSGRALKLVDRLPYKAGEKFTWLFEVTNSAPLDVQLVWVDYPGSASGSQTSARLVNNLDLTVESLSDATVYLGNGGDKADMKNNAEVVRLYQAKPGWYRVTVSCRTVLYDHEDGGAAAIYMRGAFDPDAFDSSLDKVSIRETGVNYESFVDALIAGAPESGLENPTFDILQPAELPFDWTIGYDCTICSTNGDPRHTPIKASGILSVQKEMRVLFTNVVFTGNAPSIRVMDGGTAALAGSVGLNGILLEGSGRLEMAGALDTSFFYRVTADEGHRGRGETFGIATGLSLEEAQTYASLFVNDLADELVGAAVDDGNGGIALKWEVGSIPDSAAAARLVQGSESINFASLKTLFKYVTNSAEIVVLTNCVLEGSQMLTNRAITIRSEFGAKVTPAPEKDSFASFALGAGGKLTLSNVVFSAFSRFGDDKAFVTVGAGAEFILLKGAELRNIQNSPYGAVIVEKNGSMAMCPGSVIAGCTASEGKADTGWGGGIYLNAGANLALDGATITGCQAEKCGGGIYVNATAKVTLTGATTVERNVQKSGLGGTANSREDDIYIDSATAMPLTVKDGLTGTRLGGSIGVRRKGDENPYYGDDVEGEEFANLAEGMELSAKETAAAAFFCDEYHDYFTGLVGGVEPDSGETLVWARTKVKPGSVPEAEGEISVQIGAETTYFKSLAAAFASVATDEVARVTLLTNVLIDAEVSVKGDVTLTGGQHEIYRLDNYRITVSGAGNSLCLTNVTVNGVYFGNRITSTCTLFRSEDGGLLTLDDGAVILKLRGFSTVSRTEAAVSVHNGLLTMRDGSAIRNCKPDDEDYICAGGGVIVAGTNAVFRFEGGTITDCEATTGGGVQIENGARFIVSGDGRIVGNLESNLYVADLCEVTLADRFTGSIGHSHGKPGQLTNPNVFGEVSEEYAGALVDLAPSATNFFRDAEQDVTGRIVTNATRALLVWSSAIDENGRFIDDRDGSVYGEVVGGSPVPPPPPGPQWEVVTNQPTPIAFKSIDRVNDTEWTLVITDRVEYCNYRLLWTTNLVEGFISTGAWEHAVGPAADPIWTTNVITTGGAWFWRAEGADGTNMVLKTEE